MLADPAPQRVAIALPPRLATIAALGGGALLVLLALVLGGIGRLNIDPLTPAVPAQLRRIVPAIAGAVVPLAEDIDAADLPGLTTSRQVQCLTLAHREGLDRKTGGPLDAGEPAIGPRPAGCNDVAPTTTAAP